MEIRLLSAAKEDLREGYRFYEAQSEGLGNYLLDCVQEDVRSLVIYAGVHAEAEGVHRVLVKRLPFITSLTRRGLTSIRFWIAVGTPHGYRRD